MRPDVPEAEDPGPVGDHTDVVPLACLLEGLLYILLDIPAGLGDPRGVPDGEVLEAPDGTLWHHLDLPPVERMVGRGDLAPLGGLGEEIFFINCHMSISPLINGEYV
jgi:hypothetical protein